MRRLVPILGLSLALLAAACGDDDQQAETTDGSSTTTVVPPGDGPQGDDEGTDGGTGTEAGDGVLLTLDVHGGFVPVELSVGDTADVVVLTDGRVLSGAPTIAIYPGPALPAFQISTAEQAAVDEVVEAIEALDPDADYDQGSQMQVADAPTTTLRFHRGDGTVEISAYALGMGDAAGPRQALQDVVDKINGLATGTGETPYEPTALRVHDITDLAGPPAETEPGEPSGTVRDWPLPHDGAECAVVTDPAQVQAALEVLRASTQLDRFRTDVGERRLVVVPRLPGDPGCTEG